MLLVKIDMSKASIVKRQDDVLLKICIEHVMKFCDSVICSVLWLFDNCLETNEKKWRIVKFK